MVLQYIDLLKSKRIILASASPRRREILSLIGLHNIEICVSNFKEDFPKSNFNSGGEYALSTARRKAECVVEELQQKQNNNNNNNNNIQPPLFDILIAADTVVTIPGNNGGIDIIEKPNTSNEAAAMLRRFSGKTHNVWSAVILLAWDEKSLHKREITVCTKVEFKTLSESEITSYIAEKRNWEGKAGGYGIQDTAACFISSIHGDYYNVMGLPLHGVCVELDKFIHEGIVK